MKFSVFLTACISLFSLFTVWKPLNVRCRYYFFWPKSSDVLLYFGLIYDKTQCHPPQKLIFGLNWSCIFTVWSCMCFPCSQCSVSSDDVIFLWIKTRTIVYKKRLLLNETVIQSELGTQNARSILFGFRSKLLKYYFRYYIVYGLHNTKFGCWLGLHLCTFKIKITLRYTITFDF